MQGTVVGWAVAGAALGLGHVLAIRSAAVIASRTLAGGGILRLLVVAVVLVLAVRGGGLLPAAVGWACGFATTAAWIALGWPSAATGRPTS